jgi:hypothetical protein
MASIQEQFLQGGSLFKSRNYMSKYGNDDDVRIIFKSCSFTSVEVILGQFLLQFALCNRMSTKIRLFSIIVLHLQNV